MFNKKNDDQDVGGPPSVAPKVSPSMNVRTRSVSVIGPTLKFKGELSANEDLVIEGEIEGIIAHQDKNLTVGTQGRVRADIHAMKVEILGEVNGDIRADEVVKLAKTAVVNGNIQCGRIHMEDGAFFSGAITMDRKLSEVKKSGLSVADSSGKVSSVGSGNA
jgi:cytoskeletal protein CcmA (bactofilin family)